MRCMFVYTVSSFSVNYACLCVYHQTRLGGCCKFESFAGTRRSRRAKDVDREGTRYSHSPLAAWKSGNIHETV